MLALRHFSNASWDQDPARCSIGAFLISSLCFQRVLCQSNCGNQNAQPLQVVAFITGSVPWYPSHQVLSKLWETGRVLPLFQTVTLGLLDFGATSASLNTPPLPPANSSFPPSLTPTYILAQMIKCQKRLSKKCGK